MSEIPFGTWLPLKVGPRMEGWAVVQVKNPPRNADDLHVVRCRRKDFPEGHTHYFHYRGGHRLHGCVLGDLVRYRSQARKFKGTVIQEMKLGQSYWLTNCEPDTML